MAVASIVYELLPMTAEFTKSIIIIQLDIQIYHIHIQLFFFKKKNQEISRNILHGSRRKSIWQCWISCCAIHSSCSFFPKKLDMNMINLAQQHIGQLAALLAMLDNNKDFCKNLLHRQIYNAAYSKRCIVSCYQ
jgi:hypothetical protein